MDGDKTIVAEPEIFTSGQIREGAVFTIGESIVIACDAHQYILKRRYRNKVGNISVTVLGYYPYLSQAIESASEQCFKEKALREATSEIAEAVGMIEDTQEWILKTIKKVK